MKDYKIIIISMLAILTVLAFHALRAEYVPLSVSFSDGIIQSPDTVVARVFLGYAVVDNLIDSVSMDSAGDYDLATNGLVDSLSSGYTNSWYTILYRIVVGSDNYFVTEEYDNRLDTISRNASILTTSDNIGVNFNDISGQLDVSEIAAAVYEEVWRNIDTTNIDTSILGQWITTAVWNAASRSLTELDEDNTTIDINATTIGTATSVTNGVTVTTNNDKTGYALSAAGVDAIWDEDTTGHGTAKSFALLLKDTSAYQGAASGLTAEQIWEYDTTNINDPNAIGTLLKDTSVYQGAGGATAAQVWAYATRVLTAGIGDTAQGGDELAAAVLAIRDSLQYLTTSSGDTAVSGDEILAALTAIRDSVQYLTTSSGDTAQSGPEIIAWIDSLIKWETYKTGSKAITTYANDSDNILLLFGTDTLGMVTYYHVGDTAGYPPDSTKFFPVDSLR